MDTELYQGHLERAAGFLQARLGDPPSTALVLGSGLGNFVDALPTLSSLAYGEIPGFPVSGVIGHPGKLTYSGGRGVSFCALQGRSHFYEGLAQSEIVFPVRSLARWGIRDFVITNAAGAIGRDFSPGDLMVISDHINLSGDNPLAGPNLDALGERFPDMTNAYHPDLRKTVLEAGRELGLEVKQGVYVCVKGPSYETPRRDPHAQGSGRRCRGHVNRARSHQPEPHALPGGRYLLHHQHGSRDPSRVT